MKACLLGQLNAPPRAEDCDAFLGCALRQRLLFLKREPWKRTLLDTRDLVARVTRAMKAGEVDAASRGCVEGTSLRQALSALVSEGKAAGSRETLEALDERCGAAMEAEILRLAKAVEEAVRELRADPAQEACRALERLRVHPYRAGSEALSARLAESARACAALEPLRSLATAVADAEADSALVARELEGGRGAGVTSYHKCVHKAATLATLEASEHPRARRAAKTLREVCFQRFPVEWLRAEQRHREAPDRARCFRITQVARLITESSPSPAFLAAQAALLKWSREACR